MTQNRYPDDWDEDDEEQVTPKGAIIPVPFRADIMEALRRVAKADDAESDSDLQAPQ